jgi:hypothetical protein
LLVLTYAKCKNAAVSLSNMATLPANHLMAIVEEYAIKEEAALIRLKLCVQPAEGALAADVARLAEMKETLQRTCGASTPHGSPAKVKPPVRQVSHVFVGRDEGDARTQR